MLWQQIWFVVNMLFVTLVIVFLFVNRALTMARLEKDEARVRRASRKRLIIGILSIIAFIGMVFSFLMNMRVNG
ncbi:hypothetical protein KZ483_19465 [Paenibacillus sp. sptzw28]|uniref:hypothetical protein n=1 Tax=Paenibacillus sp. sptzw28 TaxID=715179 RepID=UPI001C6E771D|nr:hypothetical protein [Paenibacillus sp. sptzw28]QYR20034.1 hypothetical protein KZ483_19465 [Paenibacillus sp. sptzw28]